MAPAQPVQSELKSCVKRLLAASPLQAAVRYPISQIDDRRVVRAGTDDYSRSRRCEGKQWAIITTLPSTTESLAEPLMARKLKVYQTSLGFYDQAIAAPSMKAALEAWGANSNLFHQGVAKETSDPDIVAAAMAKPGVVLRRPVGSDDPFTEHAALADLTGDEVGGRPKKSRPKSKKLPAPKTDEKAARRAALEYERTERQRERERLKEASRDRRNG